MPKKKRQTQKLTKSIGTSILIVLGLFATLIGIGLIKGALGMHCTGFAGSNDCVSEIVFATGALIWLPIALVVIGAIEIIFISKDMR